MKTLLIAGNSHKRQSAAKLEIIFERKYLIMNEGKLNKKWTIPVTFLPIDEDIYPGEVWKDITDEIYPGIYNYYMISSYGRVYNRYKRRLMSVCPASFGYPAVHLCGIFGDRTITVHSLVARAFLDSPVDPLQVQVNHIDGNKMNPYYMNLEWVSPQENIAHAKRTGLSQYATTVEVTEEQKAQIRNLLSERKYSCAQIAKMLNVSKSIVSHIRYNESWSIDEDAQSYLYSIRNTLSNDDIERLCLYFQQNRKEYSAEYMREALVFIGKPTDANWVKMACNIFFRRTYLNISSKYNF